MSIVEPFRMNMNNRLLSPQPTPGYPCPSGFIRAFPPDTETRTDWKCGSLNGCPDRRVAAASGLECQCACIRDPAIEIAQRKAREAAVAAREREAARQRATAVLEDAQKKSSDAKNVLIAAQKDRDAAKMSLKSPQEVYTNAQEVLNSAKTKKATMEDALSQQTAANALLINATNGLATTKAKVDAALKAANAASAAALTALNAKKAESATAANTVLSLKTAYENAQMVADNAKTKKATMEDALAQQTAANALLINATNALSSSNGKAQGNLDKLYAEQADFIKNATVFPNTTFGIDKQYNAMSIDWTAYNAAKAELAKTDAKNILDSTAATNTLVETYNKFVVSKDTYSGAVIPALQSSKTDIDYIRNNDSVADAYEGVYGLRSKQYSPMVDAWTKVTKSIGESSVSGTIANYNAYLVRKTLYSTALLVAQNKQVEAEFQTKLAAGKEAAAQWAKSGTNGCRRIQTVATTDANMLDQNIACSDTEYISGYVKVSGYNAAPVDPKVSRDNISQYLAVKYACCTAPTPAKGARGKKGLPGLDGDTGRMGPEGPAGIDGPIGKKGESGDSGEEGEKGPRGDAGEDGISEEAGPPGKAGESVKVPYIRQVPGPMGQPGQQGQMGPKGPKGPDGIVKPAPVQPFSEVDRTIALFDIQEKINKYARG